MPQPSTSQSVLKGSNPFLEADIPDSEEIYEPTPFGISALTNVDHLMNEIFQGVEQTLERGSMLPDELHEEPEPEPASSSRYPQGVAPFVAPRLMSPGFMSPGFMSPGLTPPPAPSSALEAFTTYSLPQDDLLNDPDFEELLGMDQGADKPRKSGNGILFPAVLATLILTGGLFTAFKFRLYQIIPGFSVPGVLEGSVPQSTMPESAQMGKDQQFLEYVGRSLNRIDRTATRNSGAAGTIATGTAAALPPAPPAAPSPLVIERYVSVYQPPLFGSFTNPPGTTASNSTRPIASAAAPAPSTSVAPTRVPPAPTVRLPAPRAATVPAQPAPSQPSQIAAIAANIDPSETHSLIGLLELGDRSAALLEVNGVPQRIQVGEKIGASGWKIMSISNQTALIQRNSEVRSIYVGQQF
jgi:hypothetical protein